MANKLKVGIIGCGGIAFGKHMPSLSATGDVELAAFFDAYPDAAKRALEEYGSTDARIYDSVDALVDDNKLDVVHICTPSGTHREFAIKALTAGKHVMCEKPMALTCADAEAMAETAKRMNKKLTIGVNNRFRADSQYLKKICERGDLGEIYFAKALAVRRRAVPAWLLIDEQEQGGGPLLDIGIHALDLTLWMMNNHKPKYVVGNVYNKLGKLKNESNIWGTWDPEKFFIEDSAFGFITMENGATVILESAWALNIREDGEARTLLCGTNGGADMSDGLQINGTELGGYYSKKVDFSKAMPSGVSNFDFSEPVNPYTSGLLEARSWVDAILNDTEPVVKPEEGVALVKILEGIRESALTGAPVFFSG